MARDILYYTKLLGDSVFGIIEHNDAITSVRGSELPDGMAYHNYIFPCHGRKWRIFNDRVMFYNNEWDIEQKWRVRCHLEKKYRYIFLDSSDDEIEIDIIGMRMKCHEEDIAYEAIKKFKKESKTHVLLSKCIDSLHEHKKLITDIVANMVDKQDRWEPHFDINTVNKIYELCDGPTLQTINEFALPIDPKFVDSSNNIESQIIRKRVKEEWEN